MISQNHTSSPGRPRTKIIGMSPRGDSRPSVYEVSDDVFGLVEKMLAANQLIGPYSGISLFEFAEVMFLVNLLGVRRNSLIGDELADVALWIPDE